MCKISLFIVFRLTTRPTYRPTMPTTSTTEATTMSSMSYRFKRPEEVQFDPNIPCELEELCDVNEKNYPLQSIEDIIVSEGPAVQGIYQQVIREYPELIGGGSSFWESKRRRIGSCDTKDELKKPGWAKTTESNWVTVINTHEYPQEVRTVQCKSESSSCSLRYSDSPSSCQQQFTERR